MRKRHLLFVALAFISALVLAGTQKIRKPDQLKNPVIGELLSALAGDEVIANYSGAGNNDAELAAAKDELEAVIAVAKAIDTTDKNGSDELADIIAYAETVLNAKTVEFVEDAIDMLSQAISVFNKANIDSDFIEIDQDQGWNLDNYERADLVEGSGYNTYTADADLTIAFKMMNVDVSNCDYILIKFAEPVAAGWHLAFWPTQDLVAIPEGATEYKYVFAKDPNCRISDGILSQICMMTYFGGYEAPLVAKVEGIYKHEAGTVQGKMGDVNNDGAIDVTDAVLIIDYILMKNPNNFDASLADVNGDGDIDVTDVVTVIDVILGKVNLSRGVDMVEHPVYTAFQMDFAIPFGYVLEDVSLTEIAGDSHELAYNMLPDGSYRVVVWSMSNMALPDAWDKMIRLNLIGQGNAQPNIDRAVFVTMDGERELLTDLTSIAQISKQKSQTSNLYDLQGRRVGKNTKGLLIENGRKVMIK